jgi:hypothetical protein
VKASCFASSAWLLIVALDVQTSALFAGLRDSILPRGCALTAKGGVSTCVRVVQGHMPFEEVSQGLSVLAIDYARRRRFTTYALEKLLSHT